MTSPADGNRIGSDCSPSDATFRTSEASVLWWGAGRMRTFSLLRWSFVWWWTGLKGATARFRWGVLRSETPGHGGKVYAGPLEIVWGPR